MTARPEITQAARVETQLPKRGKALAVVLVLILAACAGTAPSSPSPQPSVVAIASAGAPTAPPPTVVPGGASAGPGEPRPPIPTSRPLPLRDAFPAAFAIASSRALLTVWEGDDIAGSHRLVTIFDDGSVLLPWEAAFGGPGVRGLSIRGLTRLQDRLAATGAFDRSRAFPPAPGWAGGFTGFDFDYLAGDAPVRVSTTNASRDPTARELVTLGEAFRDLPALLPDPGDWRDGDPAVHPFQPIAAVVTVQQAPAGAALIDLPDERLDVLAGLLPGPVESLGTEVAAPDGSRAARCTIVDGQVAVALQETAARRFDVMDTGTLIDSIPPPDHPTLAGVDILGEDGTAIVRVAWRAARPGETVRCDGSALPVAPAPDRYVARGADMVLASIGGVGGSPGTPVRLTVQVSSDAANGQLSVFYLDDGTVVTSPPAAPLAGFGIRRQTQAGRRLLDEMVAAAALPDAERQSETDGDGATRMYSATLADGRIVEAHDGERSPEATRIVALVRRLVQPDRTFPASAWRDPRPLPYRPDEVAVRTLVSEAATVPRATVSMIAPFDPEAFGQPETADPTVRCQVLPIEDALALARSLRSVTVPSGDSFAFATGQPGRVAEVSFELRGPMDTPPRCD